MRNSIWSVPGGDDIDEIPYDHVVSRTEIVLSEAFKAVPGNNWQEKLDHCLKCKCCMRHQTLRPKRLEPWTEDMAEVDIKIKWVHTTCKCDCRHMARFICRQCDEDGNFLPCPNGGPITEAPM